MDEQTQSTSQPQPMMQQPPPMQSAQCQQTITPPQMQYQQPMTQPQMQYQQPMMQPMMQPMQYQQTPMQPQMQYHSQSMQSSEGLGLAITSLIFGILSFIQVLQLTFRLIFAFAFMPYFILLTSAVALSLGLISLGNKKTKVMAAIGISLAIVSLFGFHWAWTMTFCY